MALKSDEQPTRLRGTVVESAINTFTAKEISVPRVIADRQLFDADRIQLTSNLPSRTTVGAAFAQSQLILSDDEPTALLTDDDPKLMANLVIETTFALLESAAGVFTAQKVVPSAVLSQKNGVVDSTRWRNILPDDKVWLVTESSGVTAVITATAVILGKLDKVSVDDFNALVLSRL